VGDIQAPLILYSSFSYGIGLAWTPEDTPFFPLLDRIALDYENLEAWRFLG